MSESEWNASRIAVALYCRAIKRVATRAGDASWTIPAPWQDAPDAASAEALAMATTGAQALPDSALKSIIGQLMEGARAVWYLPQVIAGNAAIPQHEKPTAADLQQVYGALWQRMRAECDETLAATEISDRLRAERLHALLQKYGWAMVAPGAADNTVSLFDATRTAAALAVCMAGVPADQDEAALLVGGDLSGLQDWLYTIGSTGAAKSLRGRSVYLQLLSEVCALYLLDTLRLPPCNLLYVGGGNFYLLVPAHMESELERAQKEMSRKVLRMHEGALYVALGWTPLSRSTLMNEQPASGESPLGQAWGAVNQQTARRKSQRFAEIDDAMMASAIGSALEGSGEPKDICAVCRRYIRNPKKARQLEGDTSGESYVCELCTSFEELGSGLPHARFLVFSSITPTSASYIVDWQQGLRQFGFDVHFASSAGAHGSTLEKWSDPGSSLYRAYYWLPNPEPASFDGDLPSSKTVWSFRPLAQCAPRKGNELLTFDCLASEGIKRWGVLRMDVDRLGLIFQRGIPQSSLAAIVGVSTLLRLFFEGYVPQQLEAKYNKGDNPALYLMYSGGDDLFIVGGWSFLPEVAWDIRQWLNAFSGDNRQVTISGGVAIALDAKYPLYQAARDADRAEHSAKDAGRDAFTLLGSALKWEKGAGEYTSVARTRARAAEVRGWLQESDRVPRSLLMTLRAIDAEWREWQKQGGGMDQRYPHARGAGSAPKTFHLGPWQWHLAYSLVRAGERSRDSALKDRLKQYVADITAGEIETLGLVARWVELWTRKEEKSADTQ